MKTIEDFIQAVTSEDFVKGHEILEDEWREWKNNPKTRDESYILKGLINGSTALALRKMGKINPSTQVWATFEKYRPLIYKISSSNQEKYIKAEKILDEKYQKIMT